MRRDLGLLVTSRCRAANRRAAICRFATWWDAERHGNLMRSTGLAPPAGEAGAGVLVVGQVKRLCSVAEAARYGGHRRRH